MVYEYSCPKCGTIEIEQKLVDPVIKVCPNCGENIVKQISKPSFILKGSGWAKDAY